MIPVKERPRTCAFDPLGEAGPSVGQQHGGLVGHVLRGALLAGRGLGRGEEGLKRLLVASRRVLEPLQILSIVHNRMWDELDDDR